MWKKGKAVRFQTAHRMEVLKLVQRTINSVRTGISDHILNDKHSTCHIVVCQEKIRRIGNRSRTGKPYSPSPDDLTWRK